MEFRKAIHSSLKWLTRQETSNRWRVTAVEGSYLIQIRCNTERWLCLPSHLWIAATPSSLSVFAVYSVVCVGNWFRCRKRTFVTNYALQKQTHLVIQIVKWWHSYEIHRKYTREKKKVCIQNIASSLESSLISIYINQLKQEVSKTK